MNPWKLQDAGVVEIAKLGDQMDVQDEELEVGVHTFGGIQKKDPEGISGFPFVQQVLLL